MTDTTLKFVIRLNYPLFLGVTLFAHLLLFALIQAPGSVLSQEMNQVVRNPIKVHTLGEKDAKSLNSIFLEPKPPSMPRLAKKPGAKKLNLSDLMEASAQKADLKSPNLRPGQSPKTPTAISGLRYGAEEFKKMARSSMPLGGAEILGSQRVALNFEVPQGKKKDELNESELKLYGFLKRGAMKYMASLSSEIKDFELKNPHLNFPLTDTKQVMTGRLTFDGQGNLKQIKMVRWTNIDKLQDFFENVMKRLDTLQNPPKELWIENGEFTVFVTLQVNG